MGTVTVARMDQFGDHFVVDPDTKEIRIGPGANLLSANYNALDPTVVNNNETILAPPPNGVGYLFENVTAANNIIGIEPAADGTIYLMFLTDPSELDLIHNSAAAPQGQRLFLPNRQQYDIREFASTYIRYNAVLDGGNGGWHLVGTSID